jgi:arabinan endo-1,5-alpha-L-arabinosidase
VKIIVGALLSVAILTQRPTTTGWSAFPFDGFVPENGQGVHDPTVCEVGGKFFCLCTNGNGFGMMRTSTDLVHWQVEGPVMDATPEWLLKAIPQHHSIWAPEASRAGSGLRMYYCASATFGKNNSWIGYAECPHFDPARPKAGWVDRGELIHSAEGKDNFNAIDPSVLTAPDGTQWMFFGSYWSGIYVTELDPATGALKHPDHGEMTLVARNPRDRANSIEAPAAIYRDGYFYLTVNWGLAAQGVRSTYRLMVGRSKSPTGPFVDARGVPMTDGGHEVLLDSSSPMFGPGGGSIFRDAAGNWRLSYHYYDARAWGRQWGLPTLQIRDILWSPDGWPLPGLPVCPQRDRFCSHTHGSPEGRWLHQVDFGAVRTVELRHDGTIAVDGAASGRWTLSKADLDLHWARGSETYDDKLQLAYGGNYYVGRNGSGLLIRGIREAAARSD